jgi:hypothetical protein
MANYLVVGTTASGTSITDGLRLNLEHETYSPNVETPVEIEYALDGSTVMSYGAGKRRWKFNAIIWATAVTSYANITTVSNWFTATTAASNLFKFQTVDDAASAVYDIIIANKGVYAPELLTPNTAGTSSIWRVPFDLIQQ